MKQYDVKISHTALSDMEQIYSYIADRLLEPDTAMGQYNRIAEAIQSLDILPERCALVESEPERTQGLRQMLVDNYSVFYIVGEDAVSVSVRPCAAQTGAASREVQRRRCEIFMWKGFLDNSRKRGEETSAFFDLLRCRKDVFIILCCIFQHKWSQSILTPRPMRMSPAPASR